MLFTADPVTGRRTRAVLDAEPGAGRGRRVGDGQPGPPRGRGRPGRRPAARGQGGRGARAARRGHRAGRAPGAAAHAPRTRPDACITDAQAVALTALGRRVEAHFGAPQDIEWALDDAGTIWLTQARPITTLYPVPPSRDGALRAFFCVSLAQGLTRPITPMGLAAFGVIGGSLARLFGLAGRTRPTWWHRRPPSRRPAAARSSTSPPCCATRSGGPSRPASSASWRRGHRRGAARAVRRSRASPRCPGPGAGRCAGSCAVLVRLRVPLVVAQAIASPDGRPPPRRPHRRPRRRRSRPPAGRHPGRAGAIARPRRSRRPCEVFRRSRTGLRGRASSMRAVARRLAGTDLDDVTMDAVLRALPHNVTTEMDLELWALAHAVRADPASAGRAADAGADTRRAAPRGTTPATCPRSLQDGLAAFLRRVRPPGRRRDRPRHAALVRATRATCSACWPTTCGSHDRRTAAPDARFAAGAAARREQALADVVARVGRRSRWRARVVGFALGRARALVGLREAPKDHLVRLIALARAELAAVGAELAAQGLLDAPDDVFFLDLREVRAAARRHRPAGTRRQRAGRSTRGSCAAGTCRGSCSRTAPSPRRSPRRRRRRTTARWPAPRPPRARSPATGPGRPRPGRGAAGARRDPRRAVHRPRLDAAVPHRGRRW